MSKFNLDPRLGAGNNGRDSLVPSYTLAAEQFGVLVSLSVSASTPNT